MSSLIRESLSFWVCVYVSFALGVTKAVDLCAAPGSWSQVLSRRLRYVISFLSDTDTGKKKWKLEQNSWNESDHCFRNKLFLWQPTICQQFYDSKISQYSDLCSSNCFFFQRWWWWFQSENCSYWSSGYGPSPRCHSDAGRYHKGKQNKRQGLYCICSVKSDVESCPPPTPMSSFWFWSLKLWRNLHFLLLKFKLQHEAKIWLTLLLFSLMCNRYSVYLCVDC